MIAALHHHWPLWYAWYRWVIRVTGTDQGGPSWAYNFWSGFGSDVAEFAIFGAIIGALIKTAHHFNCTEKGCWRIGHHPVDGTAGKFRTCHRHFTPEVHQRLHDEHEAKHPAQHAMAAHQQHVANGTSHGPVPIHEPDPAAPDART